MAGSQVGEARFFLAVSSNSASSSRHKLEHVMFHLNMRKIFFTMRVTEHWIVLPRGAVESSYLEMLRASLDVFL